MRKSKSDELVTMLYRQFHYRVNLAGDRACISLMRVNVP